MGMAGARFGRNIPPADAFPDTTRLMTPDPRLISRALLGRREFVPATTLNMLAATWIQFMVKDWFSHGEGDPNTPYKPTLEPDDHWPEPELLIPSTLPDPTRAPGGDFPPTFVNRNTAWWDGSSIYGDSAAQQKVIRTGAGGKLNVAPTGLVVLPDDPSLDPSLVPGFWAGLAMMGSLFCLEHNSVCDAIAAENPSYGDEELFQRARLVVTALIAKIHTVQWTPAIISHPTTVAALRANWYGVAGQKLKDAFGRVSGSEILSGIVGGHVDHFGTPYSLTEEFSIVYRMHPLIPDDYEIRSARDDSAVASYDLRQLSGPAGKQVLLESDMGDLLYSFGTSNPGRSGAAELPEVPAGVPAPGRQVHRPRRHRHRAHPRARRAALQRVPPPAAPEAGRELRRPHRRRRRCSRCSPTSTTSIDDVDTIVGMFAEKRPQGFGFSDTAFRIFILMASRRLNSDRFFTDDFRPEVYSPAGFRWVQDNDMTTVLLRHYPQLRPALHGVDNPFAPWPRATAAR